MMRGSHYHVEPSGPLQGRIHPSGSKHVGLRTLVASLLTHEAIEVDNFPSGLRDSITLCDLLRCYGKSIELRASSIKVWGESLPNPPNSSGATVDIRPTTLMLGPLLADHSVVRVPLPGGCPIGFPPWSNVS